MCVSVVVIIALLSVCSKLGKQVPIAFDSAHDFAKQLFSKFFSMILVFPVFLCSDSFAIACNCFFYFDFVANQSVLIIEKRQCSRVFDIRTRHHGGTVYEYYIIGTYTSIILSTVKMNFNKLKNKVI